MGELCECRCNAARARRGFEQDSVPGSQRMERMDRRQEKRIISRADHEHDTKGLAPHFKRSAAHPQRAATASTMPRREHSVAARRSSHRHASASGNTSETSFSATGRRLTSCGSTREGVRMQSEQVTEVADKLQAPGDGVPPTSPGARAQRKGA